MVQKLNLTDFHIFFSRTCNTFSPSIHHFHKLKQKQTPTKIKPVHTVEILQASPVEIGNRITSKYNNTPVTALRWHNNYYYLLLEYALQQGPPQLFRRSILAMSEVKKKKKKKKQASLNKDRHPTMPWLKILIF